MSRKKALIIAGVVLLVLNVFSWSLLAELNKNNLRVVFFDVGQGDAVFIRTPQNHYILIDGGIGDVVLEKLADELPFFERSIDLVILTHPHDDHVAGLVEVLKRYDVQEVMCTGVQGESGTARRWKEMIEERGYRLARSGKRVAGDDFHIDILFPVDNIVGETVRDLNEVSVIARLDFKEHSFLFTGDAYKEQEEQVVGYQEECLEEGLEDCERFTVRADVLKIGHHGSNTSTEEDFLRHVAPKIAVIQVGEDNRYGHPHPDVLGRLEDRGVLVKRTDMDGDVIMEVD